MELSESINPHLFQLLTYSQIMEDLDTMLQGMQKLNISLYRKTGRSIKFFRHAINSFG